MSKRKKSETIDLFDLKDRIAIVTGGAGLLGVQFCHTLAEAGASVVVADLDGNAAVATAEAIQKQGNQCLAQQTDITKPDSVTNLLEATLQNFGKLDILVNSAALDPKFDPLALESPQQNLGSFEDYPLNAWKQALAVNLTGMFLCCQAAVRPMLAQGSGVIVNVCSIYGLVGPDQRIYQHPNKPPRYKPIVYSVTKAGVLGLTRYLAAYYAGRNIRVNALTPGGVYNDHEEDFVQAYSSRTVLGRMARKDEMNGALLFLASEASAYMTGGNLIVDGGWTAW